jgi:hypothetical protein
MPTRIFQTFNTRLGDIHVYELTLSEVRDRLRRLEVDEAKTALSKASKSKKTAQHVAEQAQAALWDQALDALIRFDDDFTLRDLRDLTSITDEQLDLSPSELKDIIACAREANGHFFNARRALDQLLAESIPLLVGGSGIANSSSATSPPSSAPATAAAGTTPTPPTNLH